MTIYIIIIMIPRDLSDISIGIRSCCYAEEFPPNKLVSLVNCRLMSEKDIHPLSLINRSPATLGGPGASLDLIRWSTKEIKFAT